MSDPEPDATHPDASFERMRWEAERSFREGEIAVTEREQESKEAQLALAEAEHAASRWKNPLVVAILAATVAAAGNAFVAYTNANRRQTLRRRRQSKHGSSR